MPPANPPAPDNDQPAPPVVAPPPPAFNSHTPVNQPSPQPPQKNSTFLSRWGGPKARVLIFALVFAGIGGAFIISSFASGFNDQSNLVAAYKGLNGKGYKVSTTATATYTNSGKTNTANIKYTGSIDQNGFSSNNGTLSLTGSITRTSPTTLTNVPYSGVQLYGDYLLKLTNTSQLGSALPNGNALKDWLTKHQISRLDNNWYDLYTDDQDSTETSVVSGLRCLASLPLTPTDSDLQLIADANSKKSPVTVSSHMSAGGGTDYSYSGGQSTENFATCSQQMGNLVFTPSDNTSSSGAVAVTTNKNNQITKITYSNGDNANPSVKVTANLNYASVKDVSWPVDPIGNFDAYYKYLNDPKTGEDNSLFSFSLPSGWNSDYCQAYSGQLENVQLWINQKVSGPFCGGGQDTQAWITADKYTYDTSGMYKGDSLSSKATRQKRATDAIDSKSPTDNIQSKAKKSTGKCQFDEADSTITVDGKTINKTVWTYADCSKQFNYDYYIETPGSGSEIVGTQFSAGYYMNPKPKAPDYSTDFENLVKQIKFKF